MRGPYHYLLPLLGLFLVRVDLTDLVPLKMTVDILKVYDGDTILVGQGSYRYKVRFSRIDAPEKAQKSLLYSKAAGVLSGLCLKKALRKQGELSIYGLDMYGRILGDVDEVSLKLIQQGCVTLYPHARFQSAREKFLYVRSWQEAKRLKRGLWAFGGFEQPKAWRKKNKFKKRISNRQWRQ